MTISRTRTWIGLGLLLPLAACSAFGPDRNPPKMPQPDHYAVRAIDPVLPAADGVSQQLALGAPVMWEWWRVFGSASLNDLVTEGLNHSPSLAVASNTLTAAREQLRQEIGQSLYPTVDASFSPQRDRALGVPVLPQAQHFLENIFTAQVQASYTFDFFGASILADRALAHQVQQQARQFDSTRRALATNIVVATINAASLQEQVKATELLVDMGERRAAQMEARYARGSATKDDMLSARQDAANAAVTLPPLRAQALTVRHAQAVLLGRTPDQAPEPIALKDLIVPDAIPVALPSDLLKQRPDILAAEAAVRAAADQAGAATASLFPSLTLTASYGRGGFDWTTFTSPAGMIWGVGAQLTQPIFHGGALLARRRQYQATYEASVADYKRTVLSAFQTVADDLVALQEDANVLLQAQRSADAAGSINGDTEARYKLGASPYYATLTAGQQYESATVQLVRARAMRLSDSVALLDSMGDPPRPPEHISLFTGREETTSHR
jgi:NodT family efflux transporter outer membrane factor (OMF) lipoprotein